MEPRALEVGVAALLLVVPVLAGVGGIQVVSPTPEFGDGTATIDVRAPATDTPHLSPGRFGTGVTYLRTPALEAHVTALSGQPRLQYAVVVPRLDVSLERKRVLTPDVDTVRLGLPDRALPRTVTAEAPYRGYLLVRVQSFTETSVVMNRTVSVEVAG